MKLSLTIKGFINGMENWDCPKGKGIDNESINNEHVLQYQGIKTDLPSIM